MEPCSMLCSSLDRRGVWGRMDTCICMAESLCPSPETITTLLIGYTPTQNKKFMKKKINVLNLVSGGPINQRPGLRTQKHEDLEIQASQTERHLGPARPH